MAKRNPPPDCGVSSAVTKVRDHGATSGLGFMATYEYDDLGRRTKLTYGNGIVTDYGFDGASRLTDLDVDFAGTTNDLDLNFSYNPAGQITQRVASNYLYAFLDHCASVSGRHLPTAVTWIIARSRRRRINIPAEASDQVLQCKPCN